MQTTFLELVGTSDHVKAAAMLEATDGRTLGRELTSLTPDLETVTAAHDAIFEAGEAAYTGVGVTCPPVTNSIATCTCLENLVADLSDDNGVSRGAAQMILCSPTMMAHEAAVRT